MSSWVVIPSLLALRDEFNSLNPNRDKGADGTIGDSSHTSTSDHTPDEDSDKLKGKDSDVKNEVHALDIDSTGPWPRSFHSVVMDVIAGEKAKWLDPNDMCRLNYIIWDRKIYDKDNDFESETYTGSDPHTNHAHFSARYETQAENDTRPWGVEGDDMTQDQFNTWMDAWSKSRFRAADDSPLADVRNAWRAVMWQYVGGGLQGADSTLWALSDTQPIKANTEAILSSVHMLWEALASLDQVDEVALSGQITVTLVPAVVTGVIGALTGHTEITPEQVQEATERAVRNVLGGLDSQDQTPAK